MYEIKNKNMLWDVFQSLTSSFFRSVSVCIHVVLRGNIPLKCHYSLLKYSQKKEIPVYRVNWCMRYIVMTSERQSKHYVSRGRIGKENSTPLLLFPVKSNAAFTSDAISELFHSPSSMCFNFLKFASFLFNEFSTSSGFNLISDESYVSQMSPGDLMNAQYIYGLLTTCVRSR